jgi:hypothetical protein
MLLTATKVPELNRLLTSSDAAAVERLRGSQITLTSCLFLALVHRTALRSANEAGPQSIARLKSSRLLEAIQCLSREGQQISQQPFASPPFDLYRITSAQDLLSQEWVLFYDRFRRSAANGRKSEMFTGVSGVLGEMGDNVVSHAFEKEDQPCPAIAGFHVSNGAACFCVADCGQGFLRSLQRSTAWSRLTTDREALDAVVNEQATSRSGEATGGGFKQLFKSLLDFNGLVILRSGNCTYVLESSGDTRRFTVREGGWVPGASVTVVISGRGQPQEQMLENLC